MGEKNKVAFPNTYREVMRVGLDGEIEHIFGVETTWAEVESMFQFLINWWREIQEQKGGE